MHYRYFGLSVLAGLLAFIGTQTSAACQEIRFPDGQSFCFDLQKLETDRFQAKISSIQVDTKDLSCILTLPNSTTVNLPKCEGFFQYAGGAGKITLRADIPNYRYELMTYYDFKKGSFESSSPITSDYLPEITAISTENPDLDEEIDLRLRVKNNTSSAWYRRTAYFRVEKLQNGRWESASLSDYELRYDRYTFSPSDQGEKYFDDLLRFKRTGEFRFYVELEGGNATYKSLKVGGDTRYRSYTPEWFGVSDTSPDEDEWATMSLRIHKANHTQDYEGRVKFRVEEHRNGSWKSADRSDYDLERSSYYFSHSQRGEVRFSNFIRFRENGEYKLIAELPNGEKAEQKFYVDQDDEDFSYGRVDRLELRSFSPSAPRVGDWIDLTLRALNRHGNRVRDYRATLDIELEEYRNGSWKTAYSSDFSLDQHRISFSSSDRGEKTFSDLIKFKSSGEFRIRLVDRSHYALSTTRELRVYGTSEYVRNKGTLNFTSKELSKIRAVAEIWKEVMIALERDYPRLRRSTEWKRHSENFYDAMQKILKDDRYASYQDWNAFYRGFQDWFSLTIKTR